MTDNDSTYFDTNEQLKEIRITLAGILLALAIAMTLASLWLVELATNGYHAGATASMAILGIQGAALTATFAALSLFAEEVEKAKRWTKRTYRRFRGRRDAAADSEANRGEAE